MIRVLVWCLLSVAFAHPFDSTQYYADSYSVDQVQDEGSFRQVRSSEYPLGIENYQGVPEVAFIQLNENFERIGQEEGSPRRVRDAQYPTLESENNQDVPPEAYIQLDENLARIAQDEGSPKQVRGIQYPVSESENNQGVPQVVYVQLDRNTLRNVRSLVSDQLINSRPFDRIPQLSSPYFTPSQDEQGSQNYKSFSSDNLPYISKMVPTAESKSAEDSLKDYAKELIEPSSKPESDTKQSRMFGFYYMNIQKFPAPKVTDDSDPGQKFNKNNEVEKLALDQGNENEIQKYLQQILQQQISKFVQLQNQEHLAYQQMNHQPSNSNEKEIVVPNWKDEYSSDQAEKDIKEKIAITEWNDETSFDQLGIKEKEYLIKRLHQEESWLQDSLKQVREFLKELESSSSKTKPVELMKLEDIRESVKENSTINSYLSTEPTTVPSVEFESAAINDTSNKETA